LIVQTEPSNQPNQQLKLYALNARISADLGHSGQLYVHDTRVVPSTTILLKIGVYENADFLNNLMHYVIRFPPRRQGDRSVINLWLSIARNVHTTKLIVVPALFPIPV
jgi:D-ribose pyranose/furanose isomerase RbsD